MASEQLENQKICVDEIMNISTGPLSEIYSSIFQLSGFGLWASSHMLLNLKKQVKFYSLRAP